MKPLWPIEQAIQRIPGLSERMALFRLSLVSWDAIAVLAWLAERVNDDASCPASVVRRDLYLELTSTFIIKTVWT